MSEEIRPEWDWAVVIIALAVTVCFMLGLLWTFCLVTSRAVEAARTGKPLPGDWSWPTVVATDVFLVALGGYLVSVPLSDLMTRFGGQGITRPALHEARFVSWTDISEVRYKGFAIQLVSPYRTITMTLLYFKNRDEILAEIRRRVPRQALWLGPE
jgi:hypothetical protein